MLSTRDGSFVQPAIPRFDGHYDHWSMLMENFLRSKEYWSLVETGYEEPQAGEAMKLKDMKVKNYLFQAIDRTILETILQKDTSKQIWDSMKRKYEGNARVKRSVLQALRREFETLEMKSGECVIEYFGRVMSGSNKMRFHGEQMCDVTIVEKILRSLTDKFNYIVCSIEESKDTDTLTIDELQSSLIVHEQKFHKNNGEEQALKVTTDEGVGARGRGRNSYRGRGRGRGRQAFNKAIVECYQCHQLGHFKYECPTWDKEANYAESDKHEEMLSMAYVERHEGKRDDVWFLDLGCSNHMCGDAMMFSELDESFRQQVKLGNNSRMTVKGRGNVRLHMNGLNHVITEVFYVPELKNNLLSIGQLQEKGLAILIHGGMCKIYHPDRGLIIQTAMSANRMFILLANTQEKKEACFHTSAQDLSDLWHRRYGHLSHKGLNTLQTKNMVRGLPHLPFTTVVCTNCLNGKQHRNSIPKKSAWRATQKLQLIHADICGPVALTSNCKKKYVLCFIDDFSRKTWVYFLVEKSEALNSFKCFKKLVEKETGMYIKCLRTDRGGEFNSEEFNEFCRQCGIKRQLTNAYTPQQNGVAERKNRTVMNMVRSMLLEKKIPNTFWPEAVNWAIYVLNRSPTVAVKNITPEEAWSGVKPTVEHFSLRVRTKLENKNSRCVLLGVSEESKGYRLYDPVAKRVVTSRDVVFEENRQWEWDTSYEEQVLVDLEWGDDKNDTDDEHEAEGDENLEAASEEAVGDENHVAKRVVSNPVNTGRSDVRERRVRQAPIWMEDYVSGEGLSEEEIELNMALVASTNPINYEEAMKNSKWRLAMDSEINSIEKNQTWKLTDLPAGAKTIGIKWIYKTKLNELGEVDKYKARLVAKGYSQQQGVDFTEVFAPVARMDTVRMIVALAAQKGWKIYQLDVKSAFLHGELSEDVYHKVYKLHKALYGLKQAPRAWFSCIEAHFISEGFQKCPNEQTLFTKRSSEGKILIVSIYVYDLIYTGDDEDMMSDFKNSTMKVFDMTDLGRMRFFLGIEVLQRPDGIFIYQRRYATEVLKRFGFWDFESKKSVSSPIVPGFKMGRDDHGVTVDETYFKQMVGSLMYLTATRPDIMFSVSLISRYMAKPIELHLQAAKRILRYLKGTANYGILYKKGGEEEELLTFSDSDYAGDIEDCKSTSGYVFILSSGAVSWLSKKQPIVMLSTTEAEFVAAAACDCQAVWMRRVLKRLSHEQKGCTTIMCDNSSTIKLSRNPVMHGRSKHIDHVVDLMMKPLKLEAFQKLRKMMGVCEAIDVN
uniref:Retrovirus-related Pol polyprotein from transposon TNT 1-94 n=1 Tax=Nelumbo nucifera TaxID=4432 RepID=A0A822XQ82_NELNU|nr:TPA_asm: hypothetical protein HUJ06_021091 [Nelumbo nucifera]